MRVHCSAVREIVVHSLHEIHETAVGYRLCEGNANNIKRVDRNHTLTNSNKRFCQYNELEIIKYQHDFLKVRGNKRGTCLPVTLHAHNYT